MREPDSVGGGVEIVEVEEVAEGVGRGLEDFYGFGCGVYADELVAEAFDRRLVFDDICDTEEELPFPA